MKAPRTSRKMKSWICLLSVVILTGCDKRAKVDDDPKKVSYESSHELSPEDLGIEKKRLVAYPKAAEVAIFRSRSRSLLKPDENQTYDQIFWTNGDRAEATVVIAPLSFYLGFPDGGNDSEQQFRDSWRLRAGWYGYDVKDYTFVGSSWSSSAARAEGMVAFTRNSVTRSEDLVFEFEMFVLPFEEAKKLHPQLQMRTDPWRTAYLVNEDGKGIPEGGEAPRH